MEEVFAGHDTEIFLGFVVVQTYQALVWRIRERNGGRGRIEAHPVDAVGRHPALGSVLWDICRLDDLEAGLFDIFGGRSRWFDLTDECGELPIAYGQEQNVMQQDE